jgi:RNA recognition motif-containing protein
MQGCGACQNRERVRGPTCSPELDSGTGWNYVKKIYVGNLPWSASEADLKDMFSSFGTVHSVAVISDRETGRSRGFGFIEMDESDADKAIAGVNGRELDGRALRVNEAQDKRQSSGGRW